MGRLVRKGPGPGKVKNFLQKNKNNKCVFYTLGACLGRERKQSSQRQASLIFTYSLHFIVNIHVTSNGQGENENWKKEKEGKA